MINNKDYLILRFDLYAQITRSKNENKLNKIRWEYATAHTAFLHKLIDTFSGTTFDKLCQDWIDRIPYSKEWISSPHDRGIDIVKEKEGLLTVHQWMYLYYKIPIKNTKMINFFKKVNLPFNIKIVSKV